jgi:hypothetical protein
MNDRELLELAAKAAGIEVHTIEDADGVVHWDGWNPLTDDGDALRLAVTCRLTVCPDGHATVSASEAWRDRDPNGVFVTQSVRECGDKHAATRRAIVRAAAEIGKGMK